MVYVTSNYVDWICNTHLVEVQKYVIMVYVLCICVKFLGIFS